MPGLGSEARVCVKGSQHLLNAGSIRKTKPICLRLTFVINILKEGMWKANIYCETKSTLLGEVILPLEELQALQKLIPYT